MSGTAVLRRSSTPSGLSGRRPSGGGSSPGPSPGRRGSTFGTCAAPTTPRGGKWGNGITSPTSTSPGVSPREPSAAAAAARARTPTALQQRSSSGKAGRSSVFGQSAATEGAEPRAMGERRGSRRVSAGSGSVLALNADAILSPSGAHGRDSSPPSPVAKKRSTTPRGLSSGVGAATPLSTLSNSGRGPSFRDVMKQRTDADNVESAVKLLMQLSPAQRNDVVALVQSPYKVTITKGAEEPLGMIFDNGSLTMVEVVPKSPADKGGADHFCGKTLTHVNGSPIAKVTELRGKCKGETRITLFFAPSLSPSPSVSGSLCDKRDVQARVPSPCSDELCITLASARSHSHPTSFVDPKESKLGQSGSRQNIDSSLCLSRSDFSVDTTKLLGTGSYAKVYRGKYEETDVAVKVMRCPEGGSGRKPADCLGDASSAAGSEQGEQDDWRNEVHIMSRLRHPNVLMLLGACVEDSVYLVTELCAQGTLRARLRERNVTTWETKIEWMLGVARGMAYLHHKGVQHRDLKPSNVFITEGNGVKVADFGLSHAAAPSDRRVRTRDPVTGERCGTASSTPPQDEVLEANIPGTFAFIAPEVWAEEAFANSADVYSFGVTMIEVITLCVPFDRDQADNCSWQIMTGSLRPVLPAAAQMTIPASVRDLCRRPLSFEAEARPTMTQLAADIAKELVQPYASSRAPLPSPTEVFTLAEKHSEHERYSKW